MSTHQEVGFACFSTRSANNWCSGVVMIRCDIVKGKTSQNLVQAGWDAQPRNADGFVLDLGNIGNKEMYYFCSKRKEHNYYCYLLNIFCRFALNLDIRFAVSCLCV